MDSIRTLADGTMSLLLGKKCSHSPYKHRAISELDRLQKVTLPERYVTDPALSLGSSSLTLRHSIKCARCLKFKRTDRPHFSNKEKAKLRYAIHTDGQSVAASTPINCIMCTGEQRTELYCGYCNKVMVLAKFSKVQRKSPDNAKCIICVEEQKAAEPDYNGAAVNSDDSNGDNDDDVDDDGCDSDNTLDYGDVTTNADVSVHEIMERLLLTFSPG